MHSFAALSPAFFLTISPATASPLSFLLSTTLSWSILSYRRYALSDVLRLVSATVQPACYSLVTAMTDEYVTHREDGYGTMVYRIAYEG